MSRASQTVTVAEIMTRRVRTGSPGQSLDEVWKILVDEGCHHLPILDDGRLVGMISTSDLVELARQNRSMKLDSEFLKRKTAADVMTAKIKSIQSDESVDTAIDRIGPGDFHALLVVDEFDALAGIVTHHDLLHYLAS